MKIAFDNLMQTRLNALAEVRCMSVPDLVRALVGQELEARRAVIDERLAATGWLPVVQREEEEAKAKAKEAAGSCRTRGGFLQCLVPDCQCGSTSRGLCPTHYARWYSYIRQGQLDANWSVRHGRILPPWNVSKESYDVKEESLAALPHDPPSHRSDTLWFFDYPRAQLERRKLMEAQAKKGEKGEYKTGRSEEGGGSPPPSAPGGGSSDQST